MRAFRLFVVVVAVCAAALGGGGAPAWAHNSLLAATPGDGARLAVAPVQVVLDFAERLNPRYTTVAVTTSARERVHDGDARVTGTRVVQSLKRSLPAGDYIVAYRVVSVDGHPVQGSLTFTVAVGTAPTSAATSAAAAAASSTGSAEPAVATNPAESIPTSAPAGTGAAGVAAAVIAGLVVGGGFLLRRRRRAVR